MAGNNGPVRLEETVSGMSWTDSAKQYSEERHRETLESVQDARRARQDLDTKATEYWYDHDRDIAQAMGTQPSPLLAKAYDALLLFGINLYRRDAKNAMGKLRREAKKVDAEISQIEKKTDWKSHLRATCVGNINRGRTRATEIRSRERQRTSLSIVRDTRRGTKTWI